MKKKNCKFTKYISHVLSNIEGWNSKVKEKKYTINNGDSYSLIERKIYRYLNENDTKNWQVKERKAKYRS